ncbi:uncharacterized protein LOC129745314 isoform X2 [Uranotaenia lowii]|uniref:uncharacterized protein LOC129745314 isoform X2 n=1 Tax=Uranotaenia lowii TaxID=190385 RepID=UPI00247AF878|nr:uncharacterized protein LOC129745314 isoform X2 [Uranotaenia lowii]
MEKVDEIRNLVVQYQELQTTIRKTNIRDAVKELCRKKNYLADVKFLENLTPELRETAKSIEKEEMENVPKYSYQDLLALCKSFISSNIFLEEMCKEMAEIAEAERCDYELTLAKLDNTDLEIELLNLNYYLNLFKKSAAKMRKLQGSKN